MAWGVRPAVLLALALLYQVFAPSAGNTCEEGKIFCEKLKQCFLRERFKEQCPVEITPACTDEQIFCHKLNECVTKEDAKEKCAEEIRPQCNEGEKRCQSASDGSGCIRLAEKCNCREGMEYCESKQHCMPSDQMQDGFECPLVCAVEGERFCPFTNTCIPHDQRCKCAADKRRCATLKKCIGSDEECPCPTGHTFCENTGTCLPRDANCPVCESGKFYCVFQERCVPTGTPCGCPAFTKFCPYRLRSDVPTCVNVTKKDLCHCPENEKPCLPLLKCIPRNATCHCPEGTRYCPGSGDCTKRECPKEGADCPEGEVFCYKFNQCILKEHVKEKCSEIVRPDCKEGEVFCRKFNQCILKEHVKEKCPEIMRPDCKEGEKRCRSASDGSGCILLAEKCDCGKGMGYCESEQRCMPSDQMENGFECPLVCDVEGERFCPFTNTCIPHDQRCRCAADKHPCASLKKCVDSGETCPCPTGHTFCENTGTCLPRSANCPVCESGKFYCLFEERCVPTRTPCGCPAFTKFCPYRLRSDVPTCVNVTKKDLCRCPENEKPCLPLLKCIPRNATCHCPEGTRYCPGSGDCTKGECPKEGADCPEGEVFCHKFNQCILKEHVKEKCPGVMGPECEEGEKRCRSASDGSGCILLAEKCDCGKGMGYCESEQRCMPSNKMENGFECPLVCDVEGEIFCPFTNTCIPHRQLCKCAADKRPCASLKKCIGSDEGCPCPTGHTFCENTGTCLPRDANCPVCESGKFYCLFEKRCVPTRTPCGCPGFTKFCPYRLRSDVPTCVNVTKKDLCRCPESEKPCLPLLKCIPRNATCHCPEGTRYCPGSGDCTKGECPKEGPDCPEGTRYCPGSGDCTKGECPKEGPDCPEGKVFCHKLNQCVLKEDMREKCPKEIRPECTEEEVYCDKLNQCIVKDLFDAKCHEEVKHACTAEEIFCRKLDQCILKEHVKDKCAEEARPECKEGEVFCRKMDQCILKEHVKDKCAEEARPECKEGEVFCRKLDQCILKEHVKDKCAEEARPECKEGEVFCRKMDQCILKEHVKDKCAEEARPECKEGEVFCEKFDQCIIRKDVKEKCPEAEIIECPDGEDCPSKKPTGKNFLFYGIISPNMDEDEMPGKLFGDVLGKGELKEIIFDGQLNSKFGVWQVQDEIKSPWKDLKKGTTVTRRGRVRFKPRSTSVHGLDVLKLRVDSQEQHIGLLIMPCIQPRLVVKKKIVAAVEDTPLQLDLDDIVNITRVKHSADVRQDYVDLIPPLIITRYKKMLENVGQNLGVLFSGSKFGSLEKKAKEAEERKITKIPYKERDTPKIFPVGSQLVFNPARDFFGEAVIQLSPIDVAPTTMDVSVVKNNCAIGTNHDIIFNVENVNDSPKVRRYKGSRLMLNIRTKPIPYKLPEVDKGFPVEYFGLAGEDVDGDKIGIGVAHAKKTVIGEWQYRSPAQETWENIDIDAKMNDEGFLEGDTTELLLLPPRYFVRFKPEPTAKPWTKEDAIDHTNIRFVFWDQNDELTAGLHSITLKRTSSVSKHVVSATVCRLGCDGRECSAKIMNECNECGKASCMKCDKMLNSTAVVSDCNDVCVLGSTGKPKDFGKDCFGVCGGPNIWSDKCGKCHEPDARIMDCANKCGGGARKICGQCSTNLNAGKDACGVCDGNGSSCAGCDGVPKSGKVIDACNKCRSPHDDDFNTGCISIVAISPKTIQKNKAFKMNVTATGMPTDGVTCLFQREGTEDSVSTEVVVRDRKLIELSVPAINTLGEYYLSCMVKGKKYTGEKAVLFVLGEMTVTAVQPNEFDIGDSVTELLVTGTGFIDTGSIFCVFEREVTSLGRRKLPGSGSGMPPSLKVRGEFMSSTEIRCQLRGIDVKKAGQFKVAVAPSKTAQPTTSQVLTLYAKAAKILKHELGKREILITFNQTVEGKGLGCEDLFTQVSLQKLQDLAGRGKVNCKFTQPDVLRIKMPSKLVIVNNITLDFQSDAIKTDPSFCRTSSHSLTIAAQKKRPPAPPSSFAAPSHVGRCAPFKITGNRPSKGTQCKWSVVVDGEDSAGEDVKADLTSMRQIFGEVMSTKRCVVNLQPSNIIPGHVYKFGLQMENEVGESEAMFRNVSRDEHNVATLMWSRFPKELVMSEWRFEFKVRAKLPKCVNASDIEYLWSSPSHPDLDLGNTDKRDLFLKRANLECGKTYNISVRAYRAATPQRYSSLNRGVTVKAGRLVARMTGGNRVVASDAVFHLKSKANTEALCRGDARYIFKCFDENNEACIVTTNGESKMWEASNKDKIKISASEFKSNKTYTFTLKVLKGTQSASDSVNITIAAGKPPRVETKKVKRAKKRRIIFASITSSADTIVYLWQCVKKPGFGYIDFDETQQGATGSSGGDFKKPEKYIKQKRAYTKRLSLPLLSDALEPGLDYKIRLMAYSTQAPDDIGEITMTITGDTRPPQGNVLIEPNQGISLNTTFTITAANFSDGGAPMIYSFFCDKKEKGRTSTVFLGDKSEQSSIDVELPPGDPEDGDKLTCGVIAYNAQGSSTKATAVAIVARKKFDAKDLTKITESKGNGEILKAVALLVTLEGQEDSEGELGTELDVIRMDVIAVAAADVRDAEGAKALVRMTSLLAPKTVEAKLDIALNVKDVVASTVPSSIKREYRKPKSEKASSRKRREVVDETPGDEEEESGFTSEEAENTLATFENLIDTTVINNATQDFLETVENLLISMCTDLPLGETSTAFSSTLGILRSHMTYMDDVDEAFINVSAVHGLINQSALVKFGSELKALYNEWDCSDDEDDELCNGVCATMVQYPHDFLTADKSSKRRSDVVYLGLKNPETRDYIPVEGLTSGKVIIQLPLHYGANSSRSYQCKLWDRVTEQWSTSACQTRRVFTQESALFAECGCSSLGYITVDVGEDSDSQDNLTTTTAATITNTTSEPSETTESQVPPRLTANVQFTFNASYKDLVPDESAKKALEQNIEQEVASAMKVVESMILDLTISEGSIIVNFVLLAPEQNPNMSLNYSLTKFQSSIDKGLFVVILPDGGTITAVEGTMRYTYQMARATPEPTIITKDKDDDSESTLPIILGCVFGVLVLIVVIVVVVCKQNVGRKTKVSHQNIRSPSSQPINPTCAENVAYRGSTEFGMNDIGPQRPSTGASRSGSAGIRESAKLPHVE